MRAVGSQRQLRPAGVCSSALRARLHHESEGEAFGPQLARSVAAFITLLVTITVHTPLTPQKDEVDAVSLDATHTFIAGKCGLVPVVTEYYGMRGFFEVLLRTTNHLSRCSLILILYLC